MAYSRYPYRRKYRRRSTYRRRCMPYASSRKRIYKGYRSRVGGTASGYRQLAVYRDPFSTQTNNPKIPDGKCALSAGQRFQVLKEFSCDSTQSATTIVLYPGLGAGACIWGSGGSVNNFEMAYDQHGSLVMPTRQQIQVSAESNDIAQWRVVSQGAQFSLLNNAEENDGWFETVRLTVSRDPRNYAITPKNEEIDLNTAVEPSATEAMTVLPTYTESNKLLFGVNVSNLVDNPTYRTGKLRDIHKHRFILGQESNDHDFIRLDTTYHSESVNCTVDNSKVLSDACDSNQRLIDKVIDPTFDIVVIRIHGRASTSNPSKVLCHLVCNQELCYENGSRLSRFHSETTKMDVDRPAKRARSSP